MAILQTLREKAGVFVAGAIGLSLFIFVISDFFGIEHNRRPKEAEEENQGNIGQVIQQMTRLKGICPRLKRRPKLPKELENQVRENQ